MSKACLRQGGLVTPRCHAYASNLQNDWSFYRTHILRNDFRVMRRYISLKAAFAKLLFSLLKTDCFGDGVLYQSYFVKV